MVKVYDVTIDEDREVTQEEFDRLNVLAEAQRLANRIMQFAWKGLHKETLEELASFEGKLQDWYDAAQAQEFRKALGLAEQEAKEVKSDEA